MMRITDSKPPLAIERLEAFEKQLGYALPEEYRVFLLQHNGGTVEPSEFEFVDTDGNPSDSLVDYFLGIDDDYLNNLEMYYKTFTLGERMPANIVPIANDPFGNQICLSISGDDRGKIYFWDHEEEDRPGYENLALIAENFHEFLNGLKEL